MNDYLEFLPHADKAEILARRQIHRKQLTSRKKGVLRYSLPWQSIKDIRAQHLELDGDKVIIGAPDEINDSERDLVHRAMTTFIPWRKGPYRVFGIDIDAEWQSFRKWNRLLPELPDLQDKIIADIGASNGYYMFRMAAHKPKAVVGFEPYLHHYFTFQSLNSMAGLNNLHQELLGVEDMTLFSKSFDVVFLMGVLYHRISPLDSLKEVKKAMKPGATLIVESQAIPGEEPMALFPDGRYAKVPGTYFVPTGACLCNWLRRAGFSRVKLFCQHPMSSIEQRRTDWMTFESYSDFIDPLNEKLTVEGYPAPIRVFCKAEA